ncbi:MAG: GIY-YIG nuclease family protein [Bacteroidetes bacterium]|jgi:putative endonuclease|nr:GIY-YIG nuclease family protein [Bacteroidota bacterium]
MFYTYILYSPSTDRYYTGHTGTTLKTRLRRHNQGDNPSTKPGIPWDLKFYTSFESKTNPIKFENFIKRKKSRKYIEWLINSKDNELRE